jgi:6-phosphogluconate dehydrogenase
MWPASGAAVVLSAPRYSRISGLHFTLILIYRTCSTMTILVRLYIPKQEDLRAVVGLAVKLGLPIPGLMASLAYFDGYRSAWLPANLIQAQRDDFGAHTYERVDARGDFHTKWE